MSSSKASQVLSSANALRKNARSTPTNLAREEQKKIEMDGLRSQVVRSNLQNDELSKIIQLRQLYSKRIMFFTGAWSLVTLILIVLDSWSIWGCNISTDVLVTLVGTTFGNVIALAAIVAKGIFSRKE